MATVATFNPVLTGVLVKQFIGNTGNLVFPVIAPIFNTALQNAKYPVWSIKNDVSTPRIKKRAFGDGFNRVGFDISDDSYACSERGLESPVDDSFRAVYQNQFDADMAAVARITRSITLDQELRTKEKMDAAATAGAITVADAPTIKWDAASCTPVKDVKKAKNAFAKRNGAEPTHLILPRSVAEALEETEDVRSRIRYTGQVEALNISTGTLQRVLAEVFGIANIFIAGGLRNTANEGQDLNIDYIWGKDAFMAYCPGGALDTPNFMRTFTFNGASPENQSSIFTYRDEPKKSDVHRGTIYTDEKITGQRLCTKIPSCIG
jgi:hypothetical protein